MCYELVGMIDSQCRREFRLASRLCFPNYFLAQNTNLKLTQEDLHNFDEKVEKLEDVQGLLWQFDHEEKLTQLCEVLESCLEFSSRSEYGMFYFNRQVGMCMCVSKHADENVSRSIFHNSQSLGPTLKLASMGLSDSTETAEQTPTRPQA